MWLNASQLGPSRETGKHCSANVFMLVGVECCSAAVLDTLSNATFAWSSCQFSPGLNKTNTGSVGEDTTLLQVLLVSHCCSFILMSTVACDYDQCPLGGPCAQFLQ